jgi:hypothetical protein
MRLGRRDRLLDDPQLFERGDERPVGARDLQRQIGPGGALVDIRRRAFAPRRLFQRGEPPEL